MTSDARTSLTKLNRGQELRETACALSDAEVRAYLAATGDGGDYGESVPPLAVVALALRELQRRLSLPGGSLHTGQEVEHLATVRTGEALTIRARVAQRSERQGFVISVIELDVLQQDRPVIRARTTIMTPTDPT